MSAAEFDRIVAGLGKVVGDGAPLVDNDNGALGWGTSWVMRGLLELHEATRDARYLHRLAALADAVLERRDCERGITDHLGRSLPAWTCSRRFTTATATLRDVAGAPVARVHVAPAGTGGSVLAVPGSVAGTVTLQVVRTGLETVELADVDLDPSSSRCAVPAAYRAFTRPSDPVVELVDPMGTRQMPCGEADLEHARTALAAQTGMIAQPLAGLVRAVRADAELRRGPLGQRCDRWLDAAHAALSVHDDDWRTTEGLGWYVFGREDPVAWAGCVLPTNEFLALGRAYLDLAVATGDSGCTERAAALARTLRHELVPDGEVVSWSYWPTFGEVHRGWSPSGSAETDPCPWQPRRAPTPRAEDVTHALIDLDLAVAYHAARSLPPVFTDGDLAAFARTFVRRVAVPARRPRVGRRGLRRGRPAGLSSLVTGGPRATERQLAFAAAWLPFAPWEPAIRRHVRALDAHRPRFDASADAYAAALVARWS